MNLFDYHYSYRRGVHSDPFISIGSPTVSNSELSEFFGPHRVLGRELSEFLSAYYLCAKANSPSFSQNSPSLLQNSVRLSEFSSLEQYSRNSVPPLLQTAQKVQEIITRRKDIIQGKKSHKYKDLLLLWSFPPRIMSF